jgi:cytochrome c-type biogenesis protein CcmH/NrfG
METEECAARGRAKALASEADALMSTDVSAAIARYREALELDPTFADRWHRLGLALVAAGPSPSHGSEQAKGAYRTCIEKDPNFAECYFALGEAALWTDDMSLALYSYSKAIEHSPGEGRFYAPLGEAYLVLKRYDDADQVVEQGMKSLEKVHRNKQALANTSSSSAVTTASFARPTAVRENRRGIAAGSARALAARSAM